MTEMQDQKRKQIRIICHAFNCDLLTPNQRSVFLNAPLGARKDDWYRRMADYLKKTYPNELSAYKHLAFSYQNN